MTSANLEALESLSGDQREAVRFALYEWHSVCAAEGYEGGDFLKGFPAYVGHSSALARLMRGQALFVDRPPLTDGGYPDYKLMGSAGASLRVRPPDES
jgi:hypothetical protein